MGETKARASSKGETSESSGSGSDAKGAQRGTATPATARLNEVRLRGRLGATVREATMPSGDVMVSFTVVVERPATSRQARPKGPAVDALGCTAWAPGPRRTVTAARPGDIVEVEGALRRRFQRGGAVPTSWYDVEVFRVRRVTR